MQLIGHFRVPPVPLFQNEGRCSAFDMEIIFHSHANKTHFHKKGCAPSIILKVRVFGTRKWAIVCTAVVLSCFFVYSFVIVRLCVHLFIYNNFDV